MGIYSGLADSDKLNSHNLSDRLLQIKLSLKIKGIEYGRNNGF